MTDLLVPTTVIVLAGGGGQRLGGVSKADLRLGNYSFLEWTLQAIDYLPARVPVIVVAPTTVKLPKSRRQLYQLLEDPPGSGPACGFYAGLQKAQLLWERATKPAEAKTHFSSASPAPWVALLPVDAPGAGTCLPRLATQLRSQIVGDNSLPNQAETASAMGNLATDTTTAITAILAEANGYRQNVIGLFLLPATIAAGEKLGLGSARPKATAMKALISQLNWVSCPVDSVLVQDVDTPDDLQSLLESESNWIELFQNMRD